jgi:hypothetical protein
MTINFDSIGWTIAEGHTGEYPFQVRFRQFDDQFPKSEYPFRLNIFWTMNESDGQGYPTSTELELLHTFENRLVDAEEEDNFSVFAMALTGRNEREFVFYTSDPQEFVTRLSMMPHEEDRYPIEIHRNEDAEWGYFENEVNNVQKV